ncbi:cation/H+ exchanger [Gloeopeniophorella convolvens]|nr:cation/H+ exchanger [Gloeopeniophorella convolvens]
MGQFSRDVLHVSGALFRRAAPQQAGIFVGLNPADYNPNDPFVLWVIQSIIIVAFTQFLALILGRIRQPRVIAEVIGGVLLGPSVLGRIHGFTNTIFPTNSVYILNLTSTVGLVFFLFLVGLEIDTRLIKRNAKASLAISVAGLVVPLGAGAALAVPLYHNFVDSSVNFGHFILFVAVAVGITAFPVLCRILTETRLLNTTVGVLVLSAGIGNDVVGWILLALTVALVNASTGLVALYVLLTGAGFVLFLLIPVKWAFKWLARRTGSLEKGEPTALMMTVTLILILFSAFFTDIIGIHPIFGGFLAGLVIPKDNGFAISLVEKLEDFISLLLLPQYFALSGLKTDLGLLNNGITWGYTILICVVAFFSKFVSCSVAAKVSGFNLRESGAVGALMSCKGLVELIVLNVGFQAGILNQRVFSMFVLHALVLTFMTTPLTLLIYPAHVRTSAGGPSIEKTIGPSASATVSLEEPSRSKFSVVLDSMDQVPAAMTLAQLLQRPSTDSPSTLSDKYSIDKSSQSDTPVVQYHPPRRNVTIDTLRLVELTERASAVMKSQAAEVLIRSDPVLSVFRTFGRLNRFSMTASLSVVSHDEFPQNVADHARDNGSQMIILPWTLPSQNGVEGPTGSAMASPYNPFDSLFKLSSREEPTSLLRSQFARNVFANSPSDVALFIDRGLSNGSTSIYPHIFLCMNDGVSATVVRLQRHESDGAESVDTANEKPTFHYGDTIAFPNTVYSQRDTQTRLQSETADNILWELYTSRSPSFTAPVVEALARISFQGESNARPLRRTLELANREASIASKPLLVVAGRSRRMAVESHQRELRQLSSERNTPLSSDVAKTLGDVASAFVVAESSASLIVVQAILS